MDSEIYCDEIDGDKPISLSKLSELIKILQEKYGKHAVLRFDAGYNNVEVMIRPAKETNDRKRIP